MLIHSSHTVNIKYKAGNRCKAKQRCLQHSWASIVTGCITSRDTVEYEICLPYSMTLRIYEAPPHFINQGPEVSNVMLVAESSETLPPFNHIMSFEKLVFDR